MELSEYLAAFGAFGLLGMTWLFPILARVLWIPSKASRASLRTIDEISILVPAHNEEKTIGRTLASIRRAMDQAQKLSPDITFKLKVGANGCVDQTHNISKKLGAELLIYPAQGKWKTLRELTAASTSADWVIFADCGIEWPSNLLADALERLAHPDLMALAPTYVAIDKNRGAKLTQKIIWGAERHFKSIESSAGGPVSIHGATVFYRRAQAQGAFEFLEHHLGAQSWLNDDVVLPLTLRSLHPEMRIEYSSDLHVIDHLQIKAQSSRAPVSRFSGAQKAPREFGRRKRPVFGNLQWIRQAFPRLFGLNRVASVLALRRIFRMLWAYFAVAMAIAGLASILPTAAALAITVVGLGATALIANKSRGAISQLADAALASLLTPYFLFSANGFEKTAWE